MLCRVCQSVARTWRFRLDNMQACLRSCGKEGGLFRDELMDFVCLSPRLAITYKLPEFHAWLAQHRLKALTEQVVIGTPMRVRQCNLLPEDCGVHTVSLETEPGPNDWMTWLTDYVWGLRGSAECSGGRLVTLALDRQGEELLVLDAAPGEVLPPGELPIAGVLILLGGPTGIAPDVLDTMERELELATHVFLRLRLPGGLQHSNVALTDLLMAHERNGLLPAVLQLLQMGPQRYAQWRRAVRGLLCTLQAPALPLEEALTRLQSLQGVLKGQCQDCGEYRADGRTDEHGDWYCAACWTLFLQERDCKEEQVKLSGPPAPKPTPSRQQKQGLGESQQPRRA